MSPERKIEISPHYFVRSGDKNTLYHTDRPEAGILRWVDPKVEVAVYQDAAKGWFFNIADALRNNELADFVVLQIALSHIEGIERYRLGRDNYITVTRKDGLQERKLLGSAKIVRQWVRRKFPNCMAAPDGIYNAARCGLFHDGFVKRYVVLRRKMDAAVVEENGTVVVDPQRFLATVSEDLDSLVDCVNTSPGAAIRFMERWLERWDINEDSRARILDALGNNQILTRL